MFKHSKRLSLGGGRGEVLLSTNWVVSGYLQHGNAPVLPCSLSRCLETREANKGHRGRYGQRPDVFQQSTRQA